MKLEIKNFHEIDSTQKYCIDNLNLISHMLEEVDLYCVYADKQTQGRGKYGAGWESPVGNFSGTYVIKTDFAVENQNPQIVQRVAVAAMATLDDFNVEANVKWVNDLLINDRKIGGILCECIERNRCNYLLVGIGINLQHAPEYATSIENECAIILHPSDIVSKLGENIIKYVLHEEFHVVEAKYNSRLRKDVQQYRV